MGDRRVDDALFVIVATMIATGALGVVLSQAVIRSAVWLLLTLVAIAFLYLLLGAEFLGATQLIVYVGGTLVLLVFGTMLTAGGPFQRWPLPRGQRVLLLAGAFGFFVLLAAAVLSAPLPSSPGTSSTTIGSIGLGFLGMTTENTPARTSYLLPFEVLSVHLLVVLIGAAYLARAKSLPRAAA
ncbi:MAG: NADH-quinone oxidoreductase subunit J family protein [Gemmataceae bacterium]